MGSAHSKLDDDNDDLEIGMLTPSTEDLLCDVRRLSAETYEAIQCDQTVMTRAREVVEAHRVLTWKNMRADARRGMHGTAVKYVWKSTTLPALAVLLAAREEYGAHFSVGGEILDTEPPTTLTLLFEWFDKL